MLLSLLSSIDRLHFQIQTFTYNNEANFKNCDILSIQLIQIKNMLCKIMSSQEHYQSTDAEITRIITKKINQCDNLLGNCQNHLFANKTNFGLL